MTEKEFNEKKKIILELLNDPIYVPMKAKELAAFLDVPKDKREELYKVLDLLYIDGSVMITNSLKYQKPASNYAVGRFRATKKSFGFVVREGEADDIYIPAGRCNAAMDGDLVCVIIDCKGRREKNAEGHVLRIIKRANQKIVGYYRKKNKGGLVLPDNQRLLTDIAIPEGQNMGAANGYKVVALITDYGTENRIPTGKVIEILGKSTDKGVDILSIAKRYNLEEDFPEAVKEEVSCDIKSRVLKNELEGRLDYRDKPTVTIDGEDAKDLDDAITLERIKGGYRLGVHIADVSHYVKENSPLDKEALKRSTSVYLVDRVIPMLPRELSNGICSLNEGKSRLTLSCIMDIDSDGKVIAHKIAECVIKVDKRMSYTDVNKIITLKDEKTCKKYKSLVPMFNLMAELSLILRKKRKEKGSVDFDFPETKVMLDESGKTVEVKPYERNAAHMLIEDFMLLANETVAEEYCKRKLPFLYRTHDKPDPEKMKALSMFVSNFGFSIKAKKGEVDPKDLQKLLSKVEGSEAENLISRVALRSMKRAVYSTSCSGHFGLAMKYYTHFTSPIRRYPDLQIHRIIKENLHDGLAKKRIEHYKSILDQVAFTTSNNERRAEEAERDSVRYKICEYMMQHIGEKFDGVVSALTSYGMYVELPNTIEGMVRISDIDGDFYTFKEERMELVGRRSKRKYRLGDEVSVRVLGADRLLGTVDFELLTI